MAKQHDDWLAGLGAATAGIPKGEIKGSFDHKTVTLRKVPDGLGLGGGYDFVLKDHPVNLQCGPVPMLLMLRAKLSIEGEGKATGLQRDERTYELGVGASISGTVAFGPGKAVDHFVVHAYGAATLYAKATVRAIHTESKGWDVAPLKMVLCAKGSVGARFEAKIGDKHREAGLEMKLGELELLVVELGSWKSGRFCSVTVREGSGIETLRQLCRGPAQQLEDAARWMVESETAKKIAAKTGEVLDDVKKETGVDVGQYVEDGVAKALGEKTRGERDEEQRRALEAENALTAEFNALMDRLRLRPGQPLDRFRTAAEWNKLTAELASDRHQIANGLPPARRWVAMAERLADVVLERRTQQALHQSRLQGQMTRDQAMKQVEAAFALADRARNYLSQFVPADKKDVVHKAFNTGDQLFRQGVALRSEAAAREGEDCMAVAQQATAKFTQCRQFMLAGQQEVKRRQSAQAEATA